MKPPKKYKTNKGKITIGLDIFEVLKKEQLEKLSEDQIDELLEIYKTKMAKKNWNVKNSE